MGKNLDTNYTNLHELKGKNPDTNLYKLMRKVITVIILVLIVGTNLASLHAFTNRPSKPPVGARIDPMHPMSRGLVAWWLFNDGSGSSLNDITGKHNGSLISMDANDWVGGKFGGGLDFDGTNDIINCGLIREVDGATALTISVWFELDDVTATFQGFFEKHLNTTNDTEFMTGGVGVSGGDDIAFACRPGGYGYTDANVLAIGKVYHAVAVFDGSGSGNTDRLKIYLDNVNQVLTYSGTIPSALVSIPATPVKIGKYDGIANSLNGRIFDERLWNRALSADEVAELYRNPLVGLWQRPVKWYGVDDPPASFTPTITWW